MTTARAPARRPTARLLREQLGAAAGARVDRGAGVIRGVKVLGLESPNRHGMAGASGTVYTREALARAAPLYEGLCVNVDHPDRKQPGKDRSSRDRLGWLENVRLEGDGLYADLHLLKSDPLAEKVFEAAERRPELFGLSHSAYGRGAVEGGKYVVREIPRVESVDLVADPGTNRSLFEGRHVAQTTLRALVESAAARKKLFGRALLEMEGDLPDMPIAEPAAEPEAGDWKQDLVSAIGKLVQSGDEEDHKLGLKIMAMLKPGGAAPPAKKAGESDDEDDEKKALESRLKELEARDGLRDLCESLEFRPSPVQFRALLPLDAAGRKTLIGELKGLPAGGGKAGAPRSQPAGRPLHESKADKVPENADGKALGRWLNG